MQSRHDIIVLGAGAAGMMCAAVAGQRGASVLLVDHSPRLAEKIRISGGGRCNFTNVGAGPDQFVGEQPRFCRFALGQYTPADFVALVRRHGIAFHEKHRGQLFCDDSSERIIAMLVAECEAGGVHWLRPVPVHAVRRAGDDFEVDTGAGSVRAPRLVVATGGLSIPKIGASDLGYRIARQFGLGIVAPRPALVPLVFDPRAWQPFAPLAGIALEAGIATEEAGRRIRFVEDLLITHRGLSGPAVLQVSSFWSPGQPIEVDLAPGRDLAAELIVAKAGSRRSLSGVLSDVLPRRLAQGWLQSQATPEEAARRIAELSDRRLREIGAALGAWVLEPSGTEGYRKAEVTRGGVDVSELDPRSMQARQVPGLHFIGEVLDVTGWLGGYNFQWAWASAVACARAMTVDAAVGAGMPKAGGPGSPRKPHKSHKPHKPQHPQKPGGLA